ncbi:four helix bundle protein [Pedobacter sp. ISL-68]|uniref:four helix bundle protein n=1 Tax=unclassified Pedobacter TaxID=2628915 RepID=UPI001BE9E0D2|nr:MULTISPECIES: four helix bundle protein [unclassified Pedobacter]MBT2562815.1 four helix bundle protein [Pedobacter sp. ISL-64]MBT2593328.1 four helix bundle protein [Pedobacter sp. ISL-68]
MHTYSFEKLEVWQLSRSFRKDIYQLTLKFPKEETFGLISQIKRSASSIGACLAEGSGKITMKDKAYYTNMAYTTTLGTLNHLIAAMDLDYITDEEYLTYRSKIENITIKLSGLRNSQINKSNP